ncbi:MAG: bifunctional adenosylcobinamide kinase/adenosylcobinamide-phosphate guanylyltransferase [Candidatus Omnitrophica bacterium]|nr:bifunctional adenosylcobinamide kinase/adenosylcobinamide-phosphate guanylyltransferase [Candidatus Omnitrophota bacterium]
MFLRRGGTDEVFSHPGIVLVTGGARAGKSDFALNLANGTKFRRRLFVATAVACDREMQERITRHRKARNGRWATLEEPIRLPERLSKFGLTPGTLLLVDCLPTFLTNLLLAKRSSAEIRRRVQDLLEACRRPGLSAIFVTNEVGFGIVPDHPLGRKFRDLLGIVNQQAARAADRVYLLVAGIPVRLK